jgi:hypothetical protein
MAADKQPKNMSGSTHVVFQVGRSVVWMYNKMTSDASNISVDYKTAWDEDLKQEEYMLDKDLKDLAFELALELDSSTVDFSKHRQKTRPKTNVRAGGDLELVKSLREKKRVKSLRAKKKSNRLDTIDEDYHTGSYDSYQNLELIKEYEEYQRDNKLYRISRQNEDSQNDDSQDDWNKLFDDYKYTLSQYQY